MGKSTKQKTKASECRRCHNRHRTLTSDGYCVNCNPDKFYKEYPAVKK